MSFFQSSRKSSTVVKSSIGLVLLFVVGLILFLVGRKTNQPQQSKTTNKPQRDNNPLAIIQAYPDNWNGYKGKESDGFLIFDSPVNGVRAGFINLYNAYIKRGYTTIETIIPKYMGPGDPTPYINAVVQWTGISRDSVLLKDDLLKLGRAIERFENGSQWVSDTDFNTGYGLAMKALGIKGGSTDLW